MGLFEYGVGRMRNAILQLCRFRCIQRGGFSFAAAGARRRGTSLALKTIGCIGGLRFKENRLSWFNRQLI